MLVVILLSITITSSLAQIPGTGPCKKIPIMPDYDPSKIFGQWYGYAKFPNCVPYGRCRRTEFIDNHNDSMIVVEKQLSTTPKTFQVHEAVQLVTYLGNATYLVTKPEDSAGVNKMFTFWNTDYVSYMVKGTCLNVGPSSLYYVWVITRSPNPSQSVIAKINEALKVEGIEKEYLVKYNQTDCPDEF